MNKVKYLIYPIKIRLVIGLLTALTGCTTYGGGGYYSNGYYDDGDGYLFGGGYDNGRDVHQFSQRGSASRGQRTLLVEDTLAVEGMRALGEAEGDETYM